MSHDTNKKMLDREAVRSVIQQWNANRLDLFALSEPDEVLKLLKKNHVFTCLNSCFLLFFFRIYFSMV